MYPAGRETTPPAIPPEAMALLDEAPFGYLGLVAVDDGFPLVVPVNFVYQNDGILIHGAIEGEKMRALARDARATFSVARAYSLIPSHFGGGSDACTASQYFVSVVVKGRAAVVDAPSEKAEALAALMGKLQPEGGYRPISADDPAYASSVDETAVIRIAVETLSARVKLGQSLTPERRERILAGLAERGSPLDLETAEAMRNASGQAGPCRPAQ
jgi:uncharacterized protein